MIKKKQLVFIEVVGPVFCGMTGWRLTGREVQCAEQQTCHPSREPGGWSSVVLPVGQPEHRRG